MKFYLSCTCFPSNENLMISPWLHYSILQLVDFHVMNYPLGLFGIVFSVCSFFCQYIDDC